MDKKILLILSSIVILFYFMSGCTLDEYKVELQSLPEEAGKISGAGTYEKNEEVTVEALPAKGYEFVKWKRDDEKVSSDKTYKFEVKENKTLTAEFYLDKDWSKSELKEISKEAFTVYYSNVTSKLLSSDVEKNLNDLRLNYPGIEGRYREDSEGLAGEVSIEITELNKRKDQVEITAKFTYPHIEYDKFEALKKNIKEKIYDNKSDELINPEEIFVSIVSDINLSEKTTEKSLTIKEVYDEETEEYDYQVVEIEKPEKLFASFDELYRKAVVNQVNEIIIDLREHDEFSLQPQPPESINHYILDYQGERIETTTPPRTPGFSYFFSDSIEDIKLILSEDIHIPMTNIWEQLTEHAKYNHLIDIRPEDYFSSIKLGDTFREDKKQISFTRPYVAATMDSVIGYIDISTKKANLFSKISSGSVSDFYWSQSGEYLSYYFKQSGSGFGFLHLYDIKRDELIEISELEKFKEEHGIKQEHGGFIGEFKNITWAEEEKELHFEAECTDEAGCADGTTVLWKFDIEEKELILEN